MRYIIYGAGAIGCTLGAHLFRQDHEVILIGRDAHVRKINQDGLRFLTGDHSWQLPIPAFTSAEDLGPFTEADVIMLCVKSQHTLQCLGQLKAVGVSKDLPIVCCQNSIWNEATCQRAFRRVYGMNTVIPAVYLQPGEVINPMAERYGFVEIGVFPAGIDSLAEQWVADLNAAGFTAQINPDVMLAKGAKCLGNLTNVVRALIADESQGDRLIQLMRDEAMAVWSACGIEWEDQAQYRERIHTKMGTLKIPPAYSDMQIHGSSWQSLERGAGSIETEFLNGEVVLLGRWVGVATPCNQVVTQLATDMARNQEPPGRYNEADILAML